MFFANSACGTRTHIDDADMKQTYVCPACKKTVIQKRGNVMAHHFAHKAADTCDPWYSGKMSPWHKNMQNLFPPHCQEVIVRDGEHDEYHIADVVFHSGSNSYVVEFQHSTISYTDFVVRTNYYINQGHKVIWIFDLCEKTTYYTKDVDTNWIRVAWPGKDRCLRFFEQIDFSQYSENLRIYFHISTGKGRKIEHDEYFDWVTWEYMDPFQQRERLFVELDLTDLSSLKDFFAFPYPEKTFCKMLKDAGKNSN